MLTIDPAPPGGLTTAEAELRLASAGPNEVGVSRRDGNAVRQILVALANPLVLLLLMAGAVSAALGQVVNATLIASMVLLSVSLNFVQTFRSQRAVESLRRGVAPTAMALRDGSWSRIPRRDLVVGDRVRLAAGDLVPADAALVLAKDLHVQQAALTGESLPIEKNAAGGDEDRRVFLGTSIVSGSAEAIVTATGRATRFGDIAARLSARAPETEFERGTRRFGFLIMRTVLFLILFVMLVNVLLHRDPLQSLLFAVALAVGLTPEFLPMITSVTLARGAVRMARRKVIVKHLEAIQNFGSIDVLCSDKTGTLTSGEMALERCCDLRGEDSPRVLALARCNSALQAGLRSPLDAALLAAPSPEADAARKLDEVPFDFERRRLSVVVEQSGRRLLLTKGAPESILPLCTSSEIGPERRTRLVRLPGSRARRSALPRVFGARPARDRRGLAGRAAAGRLRRGRRARADSRGLRGVLGPGAARRAAHDREAPPGRHRDQDSHRRQRARRAAHRRGGGARRRAARSGSGDRGDDGYGPGGRGRAVFRLRARLSGAEEPDPPGAEAARPRGGLPRGRHQRRSVVARGRRRDLRRLRGRGGARRGRHHPAREESRASSTRASSRAAGPSATS